MRAGLEHGDFWRLNNRVADDLGITILHPANDSSRAVARSGRGLSVVGAPPQGAFGPASARAIARRTKSALRRRLSPQTQHRLRRVVARGGTLARPAGAAVGSHQPRLADWDRFDQVVES